MEYLSAAITILKIKWNLLLKLNDILFGVDSVVPEGLKIVYVYSLCLLFMFIMNYYNAESLIFSTADTNGKDYFL